MAIPVWAVGQVLSASDVNSWFVPLVGIKPSDTGRSTNTSVTNDPDMQISVAANATYDVTCIVQYKGGTNGASDGQFTLNAPGGSTGFFIGQRIIISGLSVGFVSGSFGTAFNMGTNGTGNPLQLIVRASVVTTASGTIAYAWAQNTSSATATTMMAGSFLSAQRIS